MASLKSLSDEQLKKKLEVHGIRSPVTASTRDILIKKLNQIITPNKKSTTVNKTPTRTSLRLTSLSSDEDEDDDSSQSYSFRRSSRGRKDSGMSVSETPLSDRNGSPFHKSASRSEIMSGLSQNKSVSGNVGSRTVKKHISKLSPSRRLSINDSDSVDGKCDFKSLSDHDLRQKLRVHGIIMPVTLGTRDIAVKKLNHAIAKSRSRLQTFSSDEDEDGASDVRLTNQDHERERKQRSIVSGGDSNVGGNLSLVRNGFSFDEHQDRPDSSDIRKTRVSSGIYYPSTGTRTKNNEEYETGSDSDPAECDNSRYSFSGGAATNRGVFSNRPRENRLLVDNSSFNGSATRANQNHKLGGSSPSDRFGKTKSDSVNTIRKSRYSLLENGRRHGDESINDHNYSDISLSGVAAESVVTQTTPIVGANHEHVRVANGRHHSEVSSPGELAEEESTWHYSIPLLLLVLLAVFFSVVAMLYVNMRIPLLPMLQSVPTVFYQAFARLPVPFFSSKDSGGAPVLEGKSSPPSSSQKPEVIFPICKREVLITCLTRPELAAFQSILSRMDEVVMPALHHQEGLFQCEDVPVRHMSVGELESLLLTSQIASKNTSSDSVVALGKLADLNPQWGLKSIRDGETLLGIALTAPPAHVVCHIKVTIRSLFQIIVGVVLAVGTCTLTFTWFKYHRHKKEQEKQQVYEMIEQILEILGGMAGTSGSDFVAVNHVRDSIIGPRDRNTKKDIWKKAVAFINNHESRICQDVQSVGGVDCVIWRWTSAVPHSPSTSNNLDSSGRRPPPSKVWQGQAFESLETTHNLPNVSFTSSLKIRNMFDCDVEFGDSWPSRIQDSILEKCEGISIVHVAVDRGSREGCVYLKCASSAEAGRAFRALHGWWYDGNLVTVKFLRDERYHQRFPMATHATRRLRPSNNKRLSLQVPAEDEEVEDQGDSSQHP